jgi:uncharacterized protein YndB with AHSA1/START domain
MSAKKAVSAVVRRRFEAAPERVFDAWLNREMLGQWMWGPNVRDEEIVHLAVDARVGGGFSFMVERDGEEIDHVGKYLELERPRRLVFTWMVVGEAVGSRVLVDIVPEGAGCVLTLTHELHPDWADFVERSEAAWATMLEILGEVLEGADEAE